MQKLTILLTALLFTAISTMAQVTISKDDSDADASAMLDVKATDGGFLPPHMTTTQRNAIISQADGLVIFNTISKCLEFSFRGFWYKNCAFVPTVTNIITGEIWMGRSLGVGQVATGSTGAVAYGDLYQWGRDTEGHEVRTGSTTSTIATTTAP